MGERPVGSWCEHCGCRINDEPVVYGVENNWCHDCNLELELEVEEMTDDRPCND